MTPENILDTYEKVAPDWARSRGRKLPEKQWLDRMLGFTPRHVDKRRILDLGCGSGQPIATYLSERGNRITGVDGAAAMVALFRATLPEAAAIHADMRGLDLDQKFDAIVAWDSFFHLSPEDQRAMFPVFARHAAPRATLLFTTGHMEGTAIGEVAGEPVYHASLDPAAYRSLLRDAGFEVLHHIPEDPACDLHTVWLARYTG